MTVGPVGADTGRGAGRVCCNRSRLPRPAEGGSMMPLAAALRTPGVDLCAATPKAWPVTITRWTGIAQRCASRELAGVFPSGRTCAAGP